MPLGRGDEEQVRRIVEQEVLKLFKPLETQIGSLSNLIVRLYNSNGGPEGIFQTWRREDKEKLDVVVRGQLETVSRLGVVEDYIDTQKIVRAEREQADIKKAKEIKDALEAANTKVNSRISKQNLLIACASLGVALFMAYFGYKEYERRSAISPPPRIGSTLQSPQDSQTHVEYHPEGK